MPILEDTWDSIIEDCNEINTDLENNGVNLKIGVNLKMGALLNNSTFLSPIGLRTEISPRF